MLQLSVAELPGRAPVLCCPWHLLCPLHCSSGTAKGFTAVLYSPGQGEDNEVARAASARLSLFHHLCPARGGRCVSTQHRAGMRPCRYSCSQAGLGNECSLERTIINLLHVNSHQQVRLLEGTFSGQLSILLLIGL